MNPTGTPHKEWWDAGGSWDGSITLLPAEQSPTGEVLPLAVYDIVEGPRPPWNGKPLSRLRTGDPPNMAVARADPRDPYLVSLPLFLCVCTV